MVVLVYLSVGRISKQQFYFWRTFLNYSLVGLVFLCMFAHFYKNWGNNSNFPFILFCYRQILFFFLVFQNNAWLLYIVGVLLDVSLLFSLLICTFIHFITSALSLWFSCLIFTFWGDHFMFILICTYALLWQSFLIILNV